MLIALSNGYENNRREFFEREPKENVTGRETRL